MEDILAALHGQSDHATGIGVMVHTASQTDSDFSEIIHNIETYEYHAVQTL
jgi:hypothetical protein